MSLFKRSETPPPVPGWRTVAEDDDGIRTIEPDAGCTPEEFLAVIYLTDFDGEGGTQ